jgi:hypothetical protein
MPKPVPKPTSELANPYPRPQGYSESLEDYQKRSGVLCDCGHAERRLGPNDHLVSCPMQIAREVWRAGPFRWKPTLGAASERPYEAPADPAVERARAADLDRLRQLQAQEAELRRKLETEGS